MPNAPGVTTTPGYSSGGSVGHRTPTAVREERPSSLRARPSALRRLHVAIALGAALVVAGAAAPAAPAAPLTAHFGIPDFAPIDALGGTNHLSGGVVSKQAGCQPKGLTAIGVPVPAVNPQNGQPPSPFLPGGGSGFTGNSLGLYLYVVKPIGSTQPFISPDALANVSANPTPPGSPIPFTNIA